jgi:FAD/FMN-containing dehydrogenase
MSQSNESLDERAAGILRASIRGEVITPSQATYDAARRVWNGLVDRHPSAIAYCTTVEDIATCVRFARQRGVLTAVRGGGHACAGTAVCEGGLVIDLSRLREISVDSYRQIIRAGAGARWRDVDRATQAFGLATPGGTDSEVGIAGLTLGGGNGWLMGLYGATCDNVRALDVVTADGEVSRASGTENADLFWAMRGGGGNFAIATTFEYQLHPVGPQVIGGMVTYPYSRARKVLEFFRDFSRTAPDELTVYVCLICTAEGTPAIGLAACYVGPMDRGQTTVRPLRSCGRPIEDALRQMTYLELQSMMDPARPAGRNCAMRSHFMRELPDGAISAIVEHFAHTPSPLSVAIIEHCHGAIARVAPDATAFAIRTSPFHFEIIGFWDDPAASATNLEWVNDFFAATHPYSSGEVYVNSLDQGESARVQEAYGPNYHHLALIKSKYDPTNFFKCNQNIPPAHLI